MQRGERGRERALALIADAGGGVQPTAAGNDDQRGRGVGGQLCLHLHHETVGRVHGRGVPGWAHDARGEAGGGEDLQRPDGVEVIKAVKDEDLGEGKCGVLSHAAIVRPARRGGKWQKCHVS